MYLTRRSRNLLVFLVTAGVGLCGMGLVLLVQFSSARAQTYPYSTQQAGNAGRDCVFKAGAAQEVTATAAASDASTQLIANTRYVVTCDQAVYARWGATAPTAAAGDLKIPASTLFRFATNDSIRYMAARDVAVDGSCWLLECQ